MARFRADFTLSGDAKAVDVRWRRGAGIPWASVGAFSTSPAIFDIPDAAGQVDVNVRPVGADRRPQNDGITLKADTKGPIENRNDPDDLTPADPKVDQDGPVLSIVASVPATEDPDEYEVEMRVSPASVTDPEDAVLVGYAKPGESLPAYVCPGESDMTVHHRLRRREDGRASAWGAYDFETARGEIEGTVGHSNDFASGTLVDLITDFAPLSISGGDLVMAGFSKDDADADLILDDFRSTLALLDCRSVPTEGTYQTADVTLEAAEDLQFQFCPVLTANTPRDFSLDEARRVLPIRWTDDRDDRVFADERVRQDGMTLNGDLTPVEVEIKVATSASESPTWSASDFLLYRPGDVRYGVRTYAVRWRVIRRFGGSITIDKLLVHHWVFCKSRPWCHVGRDYQLIAETVLTGDVASLDLFLDGAAWSELALEIDWTNADATATRLALRFNGSGSNEVFLTDSGDALADVDWHERFLVYLRPRIGDRRFVFVAEQHQYKATSVNDVGAPSTKVWDDTSTAISSIQLITNQPASAYLGTGTRARLYGRREYGA